MRAQAACLVDIVPCNCFQDAAILRENGIGAGTDLGLTHLERACSNSLRLEKSFGNSAREYPPIYPPRRY